MPASVTRRLILQKARSRTGRDYVSSMVLPRIVDTRFQVLFHSPSGVLFTFPSRYWCTIGRQGVFSLRRWSSRIPTEFRVDRGTWERRTERKPSFAYGAITLSGEAFQSSSARTLLCHSLAAPWLGPSPSRYPQRATPRGFGTLWVWAFPRSLAATWGIAVAFFSSGY